MVETSNVLSCFKTFIIKPLDKKKLFASFLSHVKSIASTFNIMLILVLCLSKNVLFFVITRMHVYVRLMDISFRLYVICISDFYVQQIVQYVAFYKHQRQLVPSGGYL